MDSFERSRRQMPTPPGSIPYGPFCFSVENGCVYSIDKFRPRFPLKWGSLSVTRDGKPVPLTDQNMISAVTSWLRESTGRYFDLIQSGPGKFGGNLYWWKFSGGIVTLHRFKPFGSDDYNYSLLMEFNPNKHLSDHAWRDLISALHDLLGPHFCWSDSRTDFALDVPFPISDVRLLSRKVGSSYMGTYYFGTRGKSGYTRVYDKRKEILDKQKQDIGREVTRVEWEARSGDPVHMDFPFIIKDLGRYEVLRYVPVSDWPLALRTYDPHTSAKIRKNCLDPVDVDPKLFSELKSDLLDYLGLDPADCVDHLEKHRMDDVEAADLERIQSQLRKWCGVEH